MSDEPLFQNIDDEDAATRDTQREVTDVGPIVGGMGQLPGSGATGIASGGMAPPITAAVTDSAVEDLTEESATEEPLAPEEPLPGEH
ncbi:MAG TPA: hypothetical protein VNT28_07925 [Candidatus Limnocylindrales bacterium]|nr:hypothetical protein [Candidatus Limnocylindrales bacterium]